MVGIFFVNGILLIFVNSSPCSQEEGEDGKGNANQQETPPDPTFRVFGVKWKYLTKCFL